jgi:photosynthetic reaction center cytochrome c subunit
VRPRWSSVPGRPAREIQGADLDAAEMDADLHFALHIKQEFTELRVEYLEKIGNREANVVPGTKPGQPPVKPYFDEQSRLPLQLVRSAESPLGRSPTQIDYGDYRETDDVEIPFRWTVAQPDGSSTIQLQQVPGMFRAMIPGSPSRG